MLWVICVKKCKILQMTLILSLRLLIFISIIGDIEETLRQIEKISEKYWAKLCLVVRNREHLQCIAFFCIASSNLMTTFVIWKSKLSKSVCQNF